MTYLIAPMWIKLLSDVGGWQCGCDNERRFANHISTMLLNDCITTRMHYCQVDKEGTRAWEITDKGLAVYEKHMDAESRKRVENVRKFYRDNSSTLEKARAWYELKMGKKF